MFRLGDCWLEIMRVKSVRLGLVSREAGGCRMA
jgi:hypothetical protein